MEAAAATEQQPSRQALAAQGRTAPGKVTGKLRRALDAMVWDGLKRPDAAQAAELSDHGLREALRRPHVRAYYLSQLEVLRTSERARNILALTEVRDQTDNQMARVNAVKALEQLENELQSAPNRQAAAGFVIVVQTSTESSKGLVIEHKAQSYQGIDQHSALPAPDIGSTVPAVTEPGDDRG